MEEIEWEKISLDEFVRWFYVNLSNKYQNLVWSHANFNKQILLNSKFGLVGKYFEKCHYDVSWAKRIKYYDSN